MKQLNDSMTSARIAIFASGSGTNAERIILHFQNHAFIRVALVLSNRADAFVLERAKKFNVPFRIFNRQQFPAHPAHLPDGQAGGRETYDVLNWLKQENISHIVLAGFMWLMPEKIIQNFPDRIINIHPALLPKFGGKGMYGHLVHEAVKASGDKETGITIHLVNEKYDEGKILFQARCEVNFNDSTEQIAEKVHALEYRHFPEQIENWITGKSAVESRQSTAVI